MSRKLEICCTSLNDARVACECGADRIELCEDLSVGGVTPNTDLVRSVILNVKAPVFVLIRIRGGDFNFDDDKTKFSLKRTYSALLSISSFDSDEFEINENDLLLLVKKNKLQGNILKKGIKKYFSYLGSPSHHLGMKIEEHEKDFKLNKIYDGSEIDTKKRSEVIEKAIDLFINSNEFKETESLKKQFLISPDQINYITENLLLKGM